MADEETTKRGCVFCKIAAKEEESRIVFEDEQMIAFPDIRPATRHHYLIIPKQHFGNPKSLHSAEHVRLLENLVAVGKEVLDQQGADTEDARLGFHWPPFNSVQHLHLHVISPVSQMGFVARRIYTPGTWWFVSESWLLERVRRLSSSSKDGETLATQEWIIWKWLAMQRLTEAMRNCFRNVFYVFIELINLSWFRR